MSLSMVEEIWNHVPIVWFLACQILEFVGSQIQTKKDLSFTRILTNLRRCHFQPENLKKFIFGNKNWPNDCRVGCKSHFNLLEFIGIDANQKEKWEQFEGAFERDEILKF